MKAAPVLAVMLFVVPQFVVAGPNAGGVLGVHDANLAYTVDTSSYCGLGSIPDSCAAIDTEIESSAPDNQRVWKVYAAFPDTVSPRLKAISFGVHYSPDSLIITAYGPCVGDLNNGAGEYPGPGWPGSDTGTAIVFQETQTDRLIEAYWFAGYSYFWEPTQFGVCAHSDSTLGGTFADDAIPAVQDPIREYGYLGFGTAGHIHCPSDEIPGDGDSNGAGSDGTDGSDGGQDGPGPEPVLTNLVSAYVYPSAIEFDPDERDALPLGTVQFNNIALADTLALVGVQTVRKSFPGFTLADTLGEGANGEPVSLPDISSYYEFAFQSEQAAAEAVPVLLKTPGIRFAEVLEDQSLPVSDPPPNDQYYDHWKYLAHDAQWHLHNRGWRGESMQTCDSAQAGQDIDAERAWSYLGGYGNPTVTVGLLDTGIFGGTADTLGHPDIPVIPLTYSQRASISKHPGSDWCYNHGTVMAGLATAYTNNNGLGVAGVCGNCSALDIEVAACDTAACRSHSDLCGAIDYTLWKDKLANALALSLPGGKRLRAILLSFAGRNSYVSRDQFDVLWRAHQQGIVLIAPSGDSSTVHPVTLYPANVPFVMGVGGSTWSGQFWSSSTSCTLDTPGGGTTIGPANWPSGGSAVDICAPGSGAPVSTAPVRMPCGANGDTTTCYYYTTRGMCSGAAAMTAGAVGLLQSLAVHWMSSYLDTDDARGLIESTVRPYSEEPNSPCPTCPGEQYGRGVLDMGEAAYAIATHHERDQWYYDVATKNSVVPGTWSYQEVGTFTVRDTTWKEYLASGVVVLGPQGGWARHGETNTFPSYGTNGAARIDIMREGIHDCQLGLIVNQQATISGYDYAYQRPSDHQWVYMVGEDNIRMEYASLTPPAVKVELPNEESSFRISSISSPAQVPITYRRDAPGRVRLEIFSVLGRKVRSLENGQEAAGVHLKVWDGTDDAGSPAAAGFYWVRLTDGSRASAKRLLLLR